MTFSDADLRRYLEGQADETLSAAIETAIASDPAVEDRLMALDTLAPIVRDAIKPVGEGRAMPETAPTQRSPWPLALAACVGAALVAGIALWPAASAQPGWMDNVAAYQALYSQDTISIVEPDAAALDQQFAHVADRLGVELSPTALDQATSLNLLRAQVLSFEGAPLGQIVFADAEGNPLALCLIATQRAETDAITTATLHGLNSASFVLSGHEYLLIGTTSQDEARALAAEFRAALVTG